MLLLLFEEVVSGLTLTADAGSYTLTGTVAGTLQGWRVDATTAGSYALTGTDVTLTKSGGQILVADSGSYLLSGTDVTLTKASNNKALTADSGSYLLTGTDVTFSPPPPTAGFVTRGGIDKVRKKRRRQEDIRRDSMQSARQARDALREALERMLEGGPYDAPALLEAEAGAVASANALSQLPSLPLQEIRIAENLIRSIQGLLQQRQHLERLSQAQVDRAVAIAQAHLAETLDIANELYRKTRYNYLATMVLMMAE